MRVIAPFDLPCLFTPNSPPGNQDALERGKPRVARDDLLEIPMPRPRPLPGFIERVLRDGAWRLSPSL
ncbi:MAG: hypothetical protein NNA24_12230 [Nitrospira sp.]|nr:hypothetical protein [Nitrospira sp.]